MLEPSIRPDNRPELAPGSTILAPIDPEATRERLLAQIPPRQRSIFRRAWEGGSRKAAIRGFCLQCVGYEPAEINRCTSLTCPLYPYREDRL